MKFKKIITIGLISIMIFSLTISAAEKENSFKEVKKFIIKVYSNYQEQNFEIVYDFMYSDIKDNLDKEKYLKFQVANTKKYNIKISDIEVCNVDKIAEWPKEYQDIINKKDQQTLYEISIKYKAIYQSDKKEKIIEKKSYVVLDEDNYYLLWDPEIIK